MKKQSDKRVNSKLRARRLETPLNWDDLVLAEPTLHQVNELKAWLQHNDVLLDDWGMRGKVKPGFPCALSGLVRDRQNSGSQSVGQIDWQGRL